MWITSREKCRRCCHNGVPKNGAPSAERRARVEPRCAIIAAACKRGKLMMVMQTWDEYAACQSNFVITKNNIYTRNIFIDIFRSKLRHGINMPQSIVWLL